MTAAIAGSNIIMTEAIRHIEETIAHHDQQIQDLSEMVTRQWREIDLLKKALLAMQDKMVALAQDAGEGRQPGLSVTEQALRDKPPHY